MESTTKLRQQLDKIENLVEKTHWAKSHKFYTDANGKIKYCLGGMILKIKNELHKNVKEVESYPISELIADTIRCEEEQWPIGIYNWETIVDFNDRLSTERNDILRIIRKTKERLTNGDGS